MKIVLFGANGRVGRLVLDELLERGHEVRAFVRGDTETRHPKLEVITGDIYDINAVVGALEGMDVVMSTLGSWGTEKKDILTTAMATIIPAMKVKNQTRIVSLTGTAAHLPHEMAGPLAMIDRMLLKRIDKQILADGETHLKLLHESGLGWTALRSPIMNNKGDESQYKLTKRFTRPFATVNRKSVALALVDIAEQNTWSREAPCIHRA